MERSLSSSLRERDKEREQHKKDEAVQLFNALLVDLVSITTTVIDILYAGLPVFLHFLKMVSPCLEYARPKWNSPSLKFAQ